MIQTASPWLSGSSPEQLAMYADLVGVWAVALLSFATGVWAVQRYIWRRRGDRARRAWRI